MPSAYYKKEGGKIMFFDDLSFDQNLDLFMGKSITLNEDGYIYGNMFKMLLVALGEKIPN